MLFTCNYAVAQGSRHSGPGWDGEWTYLWWPVVSGRATTISRHWQQ